MSGCCSTPELGESDGSEPEAELEMFCSESSTPIVPLMMCSSDWQETTTSHKRTKLVQMSLRDEPKSL